MIVYEILCGIWWNIWEYSGILELRLLGKYIKKCQFHPAKKYSWRKFAEENKLDKGLLKTLLKTSWLKLRRFQFGTNFTIYIFFTAILIYSKNVIVRIKGWGLRNWKSRMRSVENLFFFKFMKASLSEIRVKDGRKNNVRRRVEATNQVKVSKPFNHFFFDLYWDSDMAWPLSHSLFSQLTSKDKKHCQRHNGPKG